ncbi:hypothetical protein D917_06806 [Trichinella nativa]|uniref:Uncharacterized protein n=1 Tax=Trichinella nativa TaxID=6335 RepID=A0A1Y3EUV1_9BILA|nr:hypothetical protein D917_06806 [Trichinella nativa]
MIELDFLLDMEDEAQRRKWLQEQLQLHCSNKEKAEVCLWFFSWFYPYVMHE